MPGLPGECAWHRDCASANLRVASIDLDECISQLYKKQLLAESLIEAICAKAKEMLMKESNVVHISAPVTVVGDIHGQFFDMLEIFKIGGFCPDTNYLFLGMRNHIGQQDRTLTLAQATTLIVACSVSKRFPFLSA
jgi:serine/threonine-protein phosphatase PPG1